MIDNDDYRLYTYSIIFLHIDTSNFCDYPNDYRYKYTQYMRLPFPWYTRDKTLIWIVNLQGLGEFRIL